MGSRQWCYLVAVNLFFNNEVRALKLSIEPLANTDAVGIRKLYQLHFLVFEYQIFVVDWWPQITTGLAYIWESIVDLES